MDDEGVRSLFEVGLKIFQFDVEITVNCDGNRSNDLILGFEFRKCHEMVFNHC